MGFEQQVQLSLTVLLTGLAVVFVMLIALTCITKGYGAVVSEIQKKLGAGQPEKAGSAVLTAENTSASVAEDGISGEVVAAISAAVYMMYGASSVEIKSIRRAAKPNRSAWRSAGQMENTRPFRK